MVERTIPVSLFEVMFTTLSLSPSIQLYKSCILKQLAEEDRREVTSLLIKSYSLSFTFPVLPCSYLRLLYRFRALQNDRALASMTVEYSLASFLRNPAGEMNVTRNNITETARFRKFPSKARNVFVKIFRREYSITFGYLKV